MYRKLLRLEILKSLRCLPVILAGLLLFAALFLLVGTGLSRILYENEPLARATVAVVTDDAENKYTQMAMDYVSGMESTSLALDFEIMDEEDALRALNKKDVVAVMLLPEDLAYGILYGENPSVRILFSKGNSLTSVFLRELTHAVMTLLSSAQASTYATGELYRANGLDAELSDAYEKVDLLNFSYVLDRERLFMQEDTLPAFLSYLATALVLFLSFTHICYAPALRREGTPFYQLLFSRGVSSTAYLGIKYLVNTVSCFILQLTGYLLLAGRDYPIDGLRLYFNIEGVLFLFFCSALLCAFALFLEQVFSDAGAVMMQIILSILMLFLSGAILPAAFLPTGMVQLGRLLPLSLMQENMLILLGGKNDPAILPLGIWCILLFAASCLVFHLRKEARS